MSGRIGPYRNLVLEFDNIANTPVTATDLDAWNAFFDLSNYGAPFNKVTVSANKVTLRTSKNITIKNSLFANNTNIVSITDTTGIINKIEAFSFAGTAGLQSAFLYGVNYIEDNAFASSNIQQIEAPSLVTIEANGFFACSNLSSVSMPKLQTAGNNCFAYDNSLTSISLPSLVTGGQNMFSACANLSSVSFESLINVPGYFSTYCPLLSSVNLPVAENLYFYCFTGCIALTTITLPSAIYIDQGAFSECSNLSSVSAPNLTGVGLYAFARCGLTYINIPSCTNLGGTVNYDGVFEDISGLTITLNIDASRQTCNGGNPDDDIDYLLTSNPGSTVNYI